MLHCCIISDTNLTTFLNAYILIGVVTSGGPSPILGYNIAMAYLPIEASKVGTILQLRVRRNVLQAEVVKMPFVPTKYYKPAK